MKGTPLLIDQLLDLSRANVMGILNVTPDSFSDGGRFDSLDKALEQAITMERQGADIIDIGGESTRPGARGVSVQEEMDRVMPVVDAVTQALAIPVSIDTSKPEVMREAVARGAALINDVRALREAGALDAAAELRVPVCLTHMLGQPRTMQQRPAYKDVVEEVLGFLEERVTTCVDRGIARQAIVVDPGFGFGKTLSNNIELMRRLSVFGRLGLPLLVGVSRKRMIGAMLGDAPVERRVHGSVAAAMLAVQRGASIVRVHDVQATVDALRVMEGVSETGPAA